MNDVKSLGQKKIMWEDKTMKHNINNIKLANSMSKLKDMEKWSQSVKKFKLFNK